MNNATVAPAQPASPSRSTKPYPYRWWVSYTATTQTPLSIGDGGSASDRVRDSDDPTLPRHHNTVARDALARPYLVASGLKGALRAWAAKLQPLNAGLDPVGLFGAERGHDDKVERRPGFVDLHDAHLSADPLTPDQRSRLAHARSDDPSYIDAHTRIDRDTLTVADRLLFNQERVVPGTTFSGSFLVQHHGHAQGETLVRQFLGLLNAASADGGLVLGGDTGRGMGRVVFSNVEVSHFGPAEFSAWLQDGCPATWRDGAKTLKHFAAHVYAVKAPDELELHIQFTGPFLVNDPSRTTRGQGEGSVAHTPRLDKDGQPVLPASSLHGALRAQAERILRTLGIGIGGAGGQAFDPGSQGGQLIAALFGHTDRAASVEQPAPPRCTDSGQEHTQDFIAIDRFTGGGKDGAKYNAVSRYRPLFEARLRLHAQRLGIAPGQQTSLSDAARGLLLLTLRDLAEGDIPLGWGQRKGYGACQASGPNDQPLTDAAARWLGSDGDPTRVQNWLHALRALRPQGAACATATATAMPDELRAALGHAAAHPQPEQAKQQRQELQQERRRSPGASAPANRFHNSYHFVPLPTDTKLPGWVQHEVFKDKSRLGHHSHARYAGATDSSHPSAAAPAAGQSGAPQQAVFSGRITCNLTAETPFIVGGRREANADGSTTVHPYQLPDGSLSIPASSLKGLISSIAEGASGSAMRVLDEKPQLSYRKTMKESLSAVGMVVEKTIDGKRIWCVQALGFPFTSVPQNRAHKISFEEWFNANELQNLHDPFRFVEPRVYVGRYRQQGGENGIVVDNSGFLTSATASFTKANPNFHYLRVDDMQLHWKPMGQWQMLVAQKAQQQYSRLLTEAQFNDMPPDEKTHYERGILRVLGRFGQERLAIPNNKTHELFLIYPPDSEDIEDADLNPSVYPISKSALSRFLELAREANERETYLPYAPQGTRPSGQGVTDLRIGDLVFFRLNERRHVSELSFSMIWRDRVEDENGQPLGVSDFLPRHLGNAASELRSFNEERKYVSPAELIFGFVEIKQKEEKERQKINQEVDQALAMAGKLRFQDASHQSKTSSFSLPPPVMLKILANPKLNDVLYFKRTNGQEYFRRKELNPENFLLRGAKHYLHAHSKPKSDGTREVHPLDSCGLRDPNGKAPWETHHPHDDLAQKSQVSLVLAGESFQFQIDFDNLSAQELEILLYALRPSDSFRHKLGMGKPIGLGTVRIDIEQLDLVDRIARYASDSIDAARECVSHRPDPQSLPRLRKVLVAGRLPAAGAARSAIERLGNPDLVVAPVHSPLRVGQDAEKETYQWFSHNNDPQQGPQNRDRQILPEDTPGVEHLPLMRRH